tara:strand:+ start:8605 stop:9096 length:492 start_codon:yes stop_codon:yes gene_type:complete
MVDFKKVGKLIIASLQKELIGQGHKATGNLINSFEQRVIELPNSIVIEILMDEYGIYVNEGRKTGGKKVPINVLVEWIERKAIASGDKEVKSMAFAIQNTIHKEGIPTKGSFKFSNNGRRKGFIDFVIDNELNDVYNELEEQVFEGYDDAIATIVKDFNKNNK